MSIYSIALLSRHHASLISTRNRDPSRYFTPIRLISEGLNSFEKRTDGNPMRIRAEDRLPRRPSSSRTPTTRRTQSASEAAKNNAVFTTAIRNFLMIFSTWLPCNETGIKLTLSVVSSTDEAIKEMPEKGGLESNGHFPIYETRFRTRALSIDHILLPGRKLSNAACMSVGCLIQDDQWSVVRLGNLRRRRRRPASSRRGRCYGTL